MHKIDYEKLGNDAISDILNNYIRFNMHLNFSNRVREYVCANIISIDVSDQELANRIYDFASHIFFDGIKNDFIACVCDEEASKYSGECAWNVGLLRSAGKLHCIGDIVTVCEEIALQKQNIYLTAMEIDMWHNKKKNYKSEFSMYTLPRLKRTE